LIVHRGSFNPFMPVPADTGCINTPKRVSKTVPEFINLTDARHSLRGTWGRF